MKGASHHIKYIPLLGLWLLLGANISKAQDTIMVNKTGTMHIFEKDTVAFFGNMLNDGIIGLGDNSYVLMFGSSWQQGTNGGIRWVHAQANPSIEFRSPHPNTGVVTRQWMHQTNQGNDSLGAGFATVIINNAHGLGLQSDCVIGRRLVFQQGHLFLNRQTLWIGYGKNAGQIAGYNEHSFVVTETEKSNGLLIQRNLSVGQTTVFPVGESANPAAYHPLAIIPQNNAEDIGVNVFKGAWSAGTSGTPIADSSINTTWVLTKKSITNNVYHISLQHNMEDEGPLFQQHKNRAYIGMYQKGRWENISSKPSMPEMPGKITAGNPIVTAAVNSATKEMSASNEFYFTKFVYTGTAALLLFIPNVFTPNGDGYNDRFEITGIDAYPDNEFIVINRWGHEVFKVKGYSSAKQFTGVGLSEGTYYYQLRIRVPNNSSPIVYKGYLTIMR